MGAMVSKDINHSIYVDQPSLGHIPQAKQISSLPALLEGAQLSCHKLINFIGDHRCRAVKPLRLHFKDLFSCRQYLKVSR